ncbi:MULTISPECIES: GNAT family N-acetyltransferase [unclassified Roseivivax]|uniref:GNAT family N-acetyltransferase n=1 Tax=Roseivivax sp. GX 12232 TaxID=2900547 RepID=UPI001E373F60|nr:N-acetyltransferase [Roseivivax sp. GX 12232]MCE0505213.1 N-acetyltransferase [Roseivivax sp. GX 12232]
MIGRDFMQEMRAGEEKAVEALLNAAFPGPDEARIVRALRKSGEIAGEQVVREEGQIVGYLALSRFRAPEGWLCLAPIAVAPDRQGQGIGRRMCRMLVGWAEAAGQTIVVLGEPEFYSRAGFRMAEGLASPFPIDHTLVAGPARAPQGSRLRYPRAFGT